MPYRVVLLVLLPLLSTAPAAVVLLTQSVPGPWPSRAPRTSALCIDRGPDTLRWGGISNGPKSLAVRARFPAVVDHCK